MMEARELIEKDITSNGGVITFAKEPEKTRLSYDIKHFSTSYFGYFQFSLAVLDVLQNINSQLKLQNNVLRYLIIRLPSEAEKKEALLKQMRSRERAEKRAAAAPKPVVPENKEIDKQLEDIIGNL